MLGAETTLCRHAAERAPAVYDLSRAPRVRIAGHAERVVRPCQRLGIDDDPTTAPGRFNGRRKGLGLSHVDHINTNITFTPWAPVRLVIPTWPDWSPTKQKRGKGKTTKKEE